MMWTYPSRFWLSLVSFLCDAYHTFYYRYRVGLKTDPQPPRRDGRPRREGKHIAVLCVYFLLLRSVRLVFILLVFSVWHLSQVLAFDLGIYFGLWFVPDHPTARYSTDSVACCLSGSYSNCSRAVAALVFG